MHASQNEGASALDRQGLDDFVKPAQFVPRLQHPFGRAMVHQQVDICNLIEGDDLGAARLIDDEVASDLKKIGAACCKLRVIDRRVRPCHHLCHEIVEIVAPRQYATQASAQCSLVWQDRGFEPIQLRPD